MKKLNNRKFFVTVVMFALTIALMGCGKKTGTKTSEKVTIDETSVPTQEQVIQTTEPIESSNQNTPTISPTANVNDNSTIIEPDNPSREFTSYWDYKNDTFDLEEYLKSTNPSKDIIIIEDNGIPVSYCASYDNNWCIAINDGGLKVGIFGKMSTDYFYVSPKSLDLNYVKPVYMDSHRSLAVLDSELIYLESAIKLVKTNSSISSINDMETVFTNAGIGTFVYEH